MTDRIELLGLRVYGHHGVLAREQRHGQWFVVDAILEVDHRRAGRTDDLVDTINYAELAARLHDGVADTRFDLVEALAEHLAGIALAAGGVRRVRIRVAKPEAPVAVDIAQVAVVVERTAEGTRGESTGHEDSAP